MEGTGSRTLALAGPDQSLAIPLTFTSPVISDVPSPSGLLVGRDSERPRGRRTSVSAPGAEHHHRCPVRCKRPAALQHSWGFQGLEKGCSQCMAPHHIRGSCVVSVLLPKLLTTLLGPWAP